MMASWPNGKAFDFDFRLSGYMVSKDCRFDPGGGQSIINFFYIFYMRSGMYAVCRRLVHNITGN